MEEGGKPARVIVDAQMYNPFMNLKTKLTLDNSKKIKNKKKSRKWKHRKLYKNNALEFGQQEVGE